ncbi:hypothetical protein OG562_36915 [Streptomyces sp. NBC_01275]|uniref:hypothetical protein n=1 Tax=Streptomyces sp. NBC_01275 TaxID=2903807 RepID=UPI00224F1F28|nr:hypothetical protein [Streptomyces sp. NBC_01275]MCX4766460.1 hypothetical protein [Streptomyces sp. NBC_01275]
MIPGCCSRMLRAAMFAAVCVVLAALGHVMMSGDGASWQVLVGGAVGAGGAGWCLTGRERGVPLVTGGAVGVQAVLHSVFSLVPTAADHDMEAMGPAEGGGSASAGMLAAHLLAALLCGLWLAYGERAVFRLLRAVAGWLAAPLRRPFDRPAPPVRPRAGAIRGRSEQAPHMLLLAHAITSRGPPARTAVA